MKTIAFVGSSGSGKSYRAMWVARENAIDFLIDDGLLIKGNRIVAGTSAKREKTRIASVKRALFIQDSHAQQVREAIDKERPSSILILGTSLGMIDVIIKALNLPAMSKVINIEDIATEAEIEKAKGIRKLEGKHVIPVPALEIKKDFSGYFIDSLRIFRKKSKKSAMTIDDKSVVRPTFSYMGRYTISNNVIYTIIRYEALKNTFVNKVNKIWTNNTPSGVIINMQIVFTYGTIIPDAAKDIQLTVKDAIEKYTAINVIVVNLIVQTLQL